VAALVSRLGGDPALPGALAHPGPTAVGLGTTSGPVIASVITLVWLGELPASLVIVGSLVTMLGVVAGLSPGRRAPSAGRLDAAARSVTRSG